MDTIYSILTQVAFWVGVVATASGFFLKIVIDIRKNVGIIMDNLHKSEHEIAAMTGWDLARVRKYLKKRRLSK